MQTNAADKEQVVKGAKKEKTLRDQEIDDIKVVMSTRPGRRFIWRHMGNAGIFQSCFTGNSATFFNEGRRDIGLKMLAEVNAAGPEFLMQMMKEAHQEDEQ